MTLEELKQAVKSAAAIRSVQRLQPIGGPGDKVFPPTYAGGVYAVENRRIDGQVVRCVLLDSVQSQANRGEEALQDAFLPNWRELKTKTQALACDLPIVAVYVEKHGWVTSLTAPHRIHDAILRDSEIQANGTKTRFRDSAIGQDIVNARIYAASAFYKYCPTALLFGTWDSTAGEGLDSAKIPRAIVSEIIGVNTAAGVRTGSRIDPLGIQRMSLNFYRKGKSGWTFDETIADKKYKKGKGWTEDINQADKDNNGEPKEEKTVVWGNKPSDINHGNVTPDMPRFEAVRRQNLHMLPDILESSPVTLRYDVSASDGHLQNKLDYDGNTIRIRDGAVKPGGVTMDHALHTWTLSLTQLRRLRFPGFKAPNGEPSIEMQNEAARTVLAALALYTLALQQERGYWLRSRCELIREGQVKLEIVGGVPGDIDISNPEVVRKKLLEPAVEHAEQLGVCWKKTVTVLTPSEELKRLVELSDARGAEEEGESDNQAASDANPQG
jgi:CRISPR-associated protein Csb1